ncbi:DUF2088 domain-containing protein [Candidatus Poribacteria bacterium]|nr:DUF2088 domain-containing protein [Candidatus Poribacteria bacterium]
MDAYPDRSNLVEYVEDDRKRFLLHYGEGFLFERLPKGTRVIFPPPPFPGIRDVAQAIDNATEHPMECDPLSAQLRPGMKVTIVFDDISLTLPPLPKPDVRQIAIELLVKKLAAVGIDDIHLIGAIGLHRRMTPGELKSMLGARVYSQFHASGRLYNHDSEDHENLELLGVTEEGEHVELNRRAVESDLVIYVNLNLTSMDGGHKSLSTGISSYRSVYHHHNPQTLAHTRSLMDPRHSQLHSSLGRMGRIVNEHLNVFHIETTFNTSTFPTIFPFLQKREDDWSALDSINFHANRISAATLPRGLIRSIFHSMRASYAMTSVQAGKTDPVHRSTLDNIYRQQLVPIDGQCDILIAGTPYLGPYNVNSILNPLLVHCLMLGYMFNMYRNKPLVREGGVLILAHPMEYKFHAEHHPSYIELFERVLPETRDPQTIYERYEPELAANPKYLEMYRHGYAFHGVHGAYMWYWGAHALQHLAKVIVLKPQDARAVEAARRMGFDTAATMPEAVEKAQSVVGSNASITNFHWPPIFVCDVR